MDTNASGNINYWPGFVDAFSNLVLALVFVIVLLAMSLGMFSGLMAKMAIQRALIEQQIKDANVAVGDDKNKDKDIPPAVAHDDAAPHRADKPSVPPVAIAPSAVASASAAAASAAAERERALGQALGHTEDEANEVDLIDSHELLPVKVPDAPARLAVPAGAGATDPDHDALLHENDRLRHENDRLRHENDALHHEIAALRKQNATLTQAASAPKGVKKRSGVTSAPPAAASTPTTTPEPDNKFEPKMPNHDPFFNQRIESDLQRTLKEFGTQIQGGGSKHINVVIYVPNYALTENKRTALFYLISIKDYLMKRKVSPDQIRMHMAPLSPGQQEMTVSMSVEP